MSTIDEQIAQLRAAIGALETQRPGLGDAVVEAGLGPLREKLAALESRAGPEQQRKLATVLFMDIAGHTHLIRDLDPEENMALIDAALARLAKPIGQFGGRIARYQGDGFKAVFGLPTAHEDDPENAVRAALEIQETARVIAADWMTQRGVDGFAVRVGLDTGLVFAGGQTEGEDTIKGLPVNLAARLESAAEPGTILISHNTYRHVRDVFDVAPREPITLKGIGEAVQTYVVQRVRPRAFRPAMRGVEGVKTQMVGRDAEMLTLQKAYSDAVESSRTRVVTIVGEAGVGKSRLLLEFINSLEMQSVPFYILKGRATPNAQNVVYSLFRDLFVFRFDILDSDSAPVALDKFRMGMDGILEQDMADIVGHWLGFDFSASEVVSHLLDSSGLSDGFAATARAYLTNYFRALVASEPVVVLLEDIHWADDPSLDLIAHLTSAIPAAPLLVVVVARKTFFERRPDWEEALVVFQRINLSPLSKHASRELVAEILQRVEEIPANLSDLIVDSAEGNPFYVEEMVKMLIEQRVIERGITNYELGIRNEERGSRGAGEQGSRGEADVPPATDHSPLTTEHWIVHADKLAALRVPPTLTGLLQARLDGLPRPEREALQRASVVGRLFWDDVVAELLNSKREMINPTLDSIRRRELVYRRGRSAFAPAEEYIFKHALLRDVAYETVLLKHRAGYHGRVAAWLEAHAGERIGEYLGLIAEHFVLAENLAKAATYLQRIGDEAVAIGAFKAARPVLERVLTLRATAGETSGPAVTRASIALGIACRQLGDFPAAEAALERGLAGARELGDVAIEAEALAMLAEVTRANGEYDRARAYADAALPLGRAAGGRTLTLTQLRAAAVYWSTGDLAAAEARAAEALAAARALSDFAGESSALNLIGLVALSSRDSARAAGFFNESLTLARQANHLSFEARALVNLCAAAEMSGDHPAARGFGEVAVERYRELGMQHSLTIALANLAEIDLNMGDVAAARRGARETLSLTLQLGHMSRILMAFQIFGLILIEEGQIDRALALLGLALAHPALEYQSRTMTQETIARLGLSEDEVKAGLAAGAALDLETVVQEILDGKW